MSNSPFLRNRTMKLAQMAGAAVAAGTLSAPNAATEAGQEYAGLKVRLDDNLRQLQDTESHEVRVPMKAGFAKFYSDWIDGVIAANEPVQDEILMTCLVWAIDTGDFEEAVRLGKFALDHGLTMPERYNRSAACFLREDIAELELKAAGTVDPALLLVIDAMTENADMPDQAKAKMNKAIGRSWITKADAFDAADDSAPAGGEAAFVQEALNQYKRALDLNEKSGVKNDIKIAEKRLRDLKESSTE